MIGLFVIISTFVILGLIIFFAIVGMECHTAKDYYDEAPRIKYKQFVDWYAIAPDKWELCDDHVEYHSPRNSDYVWHSMSDREITVVFYSLFDYIHYKYFCWNMTRQSKISVQKKNMVRVLNGVQGDIDKLRREAEKQYQKGVDILRDKNNLSV